MDDKAHSSHWAAADRILDACKQGRSPSDGATNAIVERLEEALADTSGASLDKARLELSRLMSGLLAVVPTQVAVASLGQAPHADVDIAYCLGKVSFAQQLAEYARSKRVDAKFLGRVRSSTYERFVRALLPGELNGTELAAKLSVTGEHTSRVLGAMAAAGLVDRRRVGTNVVNSLTPNARAAAEAFGMGQIGSVAIIRKPEVARRVATVKHELDVRLRTIPTFQELVPDILSEVRERVA